MVFIPVLNIAENCFGCKPKIISLVHIILLQAFKSKPFFKKAMKIADYFREFNFDLIIRPLRDCLDFVKSDELARPLGRVSNINISDKSKILKNLA